MKKLFGKYSIVTPLFLLFFGINSYSQQIKETDIPLKVHTIKKAIKYETDSLVIYVDYSVVKSYFNEKVGNKSLSKKERKAILNTIDSTYKSADTISEKSIKQLVDSKGLLKEALYSKKLNIFNKYTHKFEDEIKYITKDLRPSKDSYGCYEFITSFYSSSSILLYTETAYVLTPRFL